MVRRSNGQMVRRSHGQMQGQMIKWSNGQIVSMVTGSDVRSEGQKVTWSYAWSDDQIIK